MPRAWPARHPLCPMCQHTLTAPYTVAGQRGLWPQQQTRDVCGPATQATWAGSSWELLQQRNTLTWTAQRQSQEPDILVV